MDVATQDELCITVNLNFDRVNTTFNKQEFWFVFSGVDGMGFSTRTPDRVCLLDDSYKKQGN